MNMSHLFHFPCLGNGSCHGSGSYLPSSLDAEAWVQSQDSLCCIFGGQGHNGRDVFFFFITSVLPCHYESANASYPLTLSDPTSDLIRHYDFPILLRCRLTSDTFFLRLFAHSAVGACPTLFLMYYGL